MKQLTLNISELELSILHRLNKLLNTQGEELKIRAEFHFKNDKIQTVFCFAFKGQYDTCLQEGLTGSPPVCWDDFNNMLLLNENRHTMFEYINTYIDDYPEFAALSKLFKPLENCSSLEELCIKLDLMDS